MARRISLPSSDELFEGRGPYAAAPSPAPRKPRAPRRARTATAGHGRTLIARIDRVETRLRDLPIDTLLELRDGLEALLLAGGVTGAEVERVLGAVDG